MIEAWYDVLTIVPPEKADIVVELFGEVDGSDELFQQIQDVTIRRNERKAVYEVKFFNRKKIIFNMSKARKTAKKWKLEADAEELRDQALTLMKRR